MGLKFAAYGFPEQVMAVYTDVAAEELGQFLAGYNIGELLSYKGIAEGVEKAMAAFNGIDLREEEKDS